MIRLPIFMYHHVSDSLGGIPNHMVVTPAHFEQQMRFLHQKEYHCLNLSEVFTHWQNGKAQPDHSFVLTFDDGYKDNYEIALPILRKFGFSATIFLVVKPVEESDQRYLSWNEMKIMSENNFTFGSHTLSHTRLSSMDNTIIEHELLTSKEIIEERLGLPAKILAYPFGDSNERIQNIACQMGYQAACGVNDGHQTLYNLWRVPVNRHESALFFRLKTYGGYYFYSWMLNQTQLGRNLRALKRYVSRKRAFKAVSKVG